VADGRLVEEPAQVDLAPVDHGGEVDQASLEVADDDLEPLEAVEAERELGFPLFIRRKKKLIPTARRGSASASIVCRSNTPESRLP
jgi:hypothetical protein